MKQKSQEPISKALSGLLDKRGLTPAKLCRLAQVSPGTVSRYLGGSRGARLDGRGARTIERIASALGVEADYFREYRAWRIREIVVASPALMDDFYDLIVETARLRGFLKDGADDADQ